MPGTDAPASTDEAGWLEALPQAVLVVCDEVVAYANPAARALFDPSSHAALLGERLTRLLPNDGSATAVRLDGSSFAAAVLSAPTQHAGRPARLHLVREMEAEAALHERLAQTRCELLALSGRFIHLREQERRHVARELHDEIGQCLSAIRVQFAKLQRRTDSAESLALIDSAAGMTERTLARVRSLSLQLHPPQLDTLGLTAALRWHVDQQRDLHGLDIRLQVARLAEPLPQDVALAAYRIVQESLSNAVHHAAATRVSVHLGMQDDALALAVSDDGRGFDAGDLCGRIYILPTLGLLSMQQRARLIGGELQVESAPGQGTRIAAWLPLPKHANHDDAAGDIGR